MFCDLYWSRQKAELFNGPFVTGFSHLTTNTIILPNNLSYHGVFTQSFFSRHSVFLRKKHDLFYTNRGFITSP